MNNYQRIKLPYELNELEWVISFKTMYYHYNILHKNYEVKLLETLRGTEIPEQFPTLENLMENLEKFPEEIKNDVRFFGGGLINHNFFFSHLVKFESEQKERERTEKISPDLLNLIQEKFGSLEKLKKELVKSALKVRGSGWTWLALNKKGELKIINTANQDGPWSLHLRPLIAIDVWEHAYYLDYGANRKEYVEKLLEFLLNWEYISQSYQNYIL
ncbi:MAG: superoxide dismutase [Mycoplasmataceae bacterium RV_VA103A]|nr:MAG: superoxide dismutase [Mycoplasmataceae bacterium RV_VA103A]